MGAARQHKGDNGRRLLSQNASDVAESKSRASLLAFKVSDDLA